MDQIKEKIEQVVAKLKADKSLLAEFKTNPVKVIEKLLSIDLSDDIVNKVIDGVKAKLAADDISDKLEGAKDALGGLFSKFKK